MFETVGIAQLAFGHFLGNLYIANEGAIVMAKSFARTNTGMTTLLNRHIRWHLSSKVASVWSNEVRHESH